MGLHRGQQQRPATNDDDGSAGYDDFWPYQRTANHYQRRRV